MMMEKEASGLYPFLILRGKSVPFVFVPSKKNVLQNNLLFLHCLCLRLPFIFFVMMSSRRYRRKGTMELPT